MDANTFGTLIFLAFFAAIFTISIRMRRSKQVYLVDYQAGLRFEGDASSIVLSPGAYRTSASGTPITVVDLRPYQFIVERLAFLDMLQENCVVSVGGELKVRNPQLAVNAFKNLVNDSLALVRENLRAAILRCIVDPSPEGKLKMATTIT
ncbi:MAG: hypothetical protein WAU67_00920, partial [Terracidiphilus sp.]